MKRWVIMEENKVITLGDMIKQIINENQLSEVDETEIQKMLEEKGKKKEKDIVCLASIIEKELVYAIQSGQICEEDAGLYKSVFEKMIKKSETGKMPATELSDISIRKFVLQAGKTYERDRTRLKCFTGMLQTGLNKMSEEDMLDFVPVRHVYKDYLGSKGGIQYVSNLYTAEETEKIQEWIELHPNDIRGLALGLWFTGDVSLLEIANLKKEDGCKGIFRKYERARFVTRALELHPQNGNYVFMIINGREWEKVTAQGLVMKLYHTCNKLGIEYKMINRNTTILYNE